MEKMKAFEKFLLSKKEMNKLTGGSDIRTINGCTYLVRPITVKKSIIS